MFLAVFSGVQHSGKTLMEDGYMRMVKATAEEGTELLGYTIMLIAMIELWVAMPKLIEKLKN